MRFEVPQFIDVEDKLFGPFTFKQFIYLAGGAGIVYTLFRVLPLFLAVIIALPIAGLALALVFYKPNNRPFIKMVESVVNFFIKSRFYLWKRNQVKKTVQSIEKSSVATVESDNKLKDLAWSLDILDQNK